MNCNVFKLACLDTFGWNDGYGNDCTFYEQHACEDGQAMHLQEGMMGNHNNYPEENCCVCGKGLPGI